jgi:hypothetical protein
MSRSVIGLVAVLLALVLPAAPAAAQHADFTTPVLTAAPVNPITGSSGSTCRSTPTTSLGACSAACGGGVQAVTWSDGCGSGGAFDQVCNAQGCPVYGSCGGGQWSCASGVIYGLYDSGSTSSWSCAGAYGGANASCQSCDVGYVLSGSACVPLVTPGSMTWTIPGTYYFVVPAHNTLTAQAWGGGGGGGSGENASLWLAGGNGSNGGDSSVAGYITAGGGYGGDQGGYYMAYNIYYNIIFAYGGGYSGGAGHNGGNGSNSNLWNGAGTNGNSSWAGGSGGLGGIGFAGCCAAPAATNGEAPGGGGGGGGSDGPGAGGGGGGGETSEAISSATGSTLTIVVGAGGAGAPSTIGRYGGNGADGQVTVSWQ